MFDTYGPYVLAKHDDEGIDQFFSQIQEDVTADVQYGVGIYIVAARGADGSIVPWYVGRTYKEFSYRILQHFRARKFSELCESGSLTFFLLARARDGKILRAQQSEGNAMSKKSIAYLELILIGACIKLNPELMNKQEKRFHQILHVAGFLDRGPQERDFPAAQALAALLHT